MDKINFKEAFTKRYPERAYLVREMGTAIGKKDVDWADMTKVNLVAIHDHICDTHAPNSAVTLLAVIKSFLNVYSETGLIPCKDFARVLRARKCPSEHIALTYRELKRLEAYVPKTPTERDVKILAMREALTGARGVDAENLSMKNVSDGFLSYVSSKTKRASVIPVHHLLPKYLEAKVLSSHNRKVKNTVLQRMCKNVGINQMCHVFVKGEEQYKPKYELVGFHTMRRTFCSILAQKGAPISLIKEYAGHSNESMTSRYICIDPKVENKAAMSFFNG